MERAYAVDASGRIQQHVVSNVGGVEGLVTEPVSPSLIQPRWDGKKWVESASNTERSQALADHRRGCVTQLQVEAEAVRGALYPMGPHALAVREQKLREARCLLQGGPKEEPVVLAAEGEKEELAQLLEKQNDIQQFQLYENLFLPEDREFVRNRYIGLLSGYLSQHFGRQASAFARQHLSGLLQKGEQELVIGIIRDLVARFADRPTLPEELAELFPKSKRKAILQPEKL